MELKLLNNNYNDKITNSYSIDPIKKLREIEFPVNERKVKEQFKNRESKLHQAYFDSDENNILLAFEAGKFLQSKGIAEKKLFIFSLNEKKVIDEVDIDFTPISYEAESNTLVGLKYINSKEFILEKYKLTY